MWAGMGLLSYWGLSSLPYHAVWLSAALSSHGPCWSKLWSEDWFLGLTLVLPCHLDLPSNDWAMYDPGYQHWASSWFVDLCCWLNRRPGYHHDLFWWSGQFFWSWLPCLALPGTVGWWGPCPDCCIPALDSLQPAQQLLLLLPFSKAAVSFACGIHTCVTWKF